MTDLNADVASTHPDDEDAVASAQRIETNVEELLNGIGVEIDRRLADHETTKANAKAAVLRALGNRTLRRAGVTAPADPDSAPQVPDEPPAGTADNGSNRQPLIVPTLSSGEGSHPTSAQGDSSAQGPEEVPEQAPLAES